ncbi:MAG: hypothetical protein ACT4PN_16250 [Nitrospiraceae bacterium]
MEKPSKRRIRSGVGPSGPLGPPKNKKGEVGWMKFLESIKEILKQEFGSPLDEVLPEPVVDTESEALIPPLLPGWLIAHRDQRGRLRGGCDEREVGTVNGCEWTGSSWIVTLPNGDRLPLSKIVSVARTDAQGQVVAAWTVREHGYDGERGES